MKQSVSDFEPLTKYQYHDQVKVDDMSGKRNMHGRDEKYKKILVRKSEGKKPLVIHRHRWKNTIN
jgi:hypothetical protein